MANQKVEDLSLESGPFAATEFFLTGVAGNRSKKRPITVVAPATVKFFDMVKELPGSADTYFLVLDASFAFDILSATYKTTAGTCTLNVKINATSVTGLAALALTTAEAGPTAATAARSVALGDDVSAQLTVPVGMGRGVLKLKCERT